MKKLSFYGEKNLRDNIVKIKTRKFGEIDIEKGKIIRMPAGLPGFPGRNRYVILDRKETRPFYWYQSVDDPDLAIVIMSPYLFKPEYYIDLAPAFKEMSWNAEKPENLLIYVVVNASDGGREKITANLIGPLVVNSRKREAIQMIISDSPYSHKHPIFS